MSSHEISFSTKLSEPPRTRANFTYKISPTVISIFDTGLGKCPVTEDIEAVLRKIEYWHQGLIAAFKTMCRNEHGVWDGVRWDVRTVAFNALEDEDEKREMAAF
jgi:hypothetical protein